MARKDFEQLATQSAGKAKNEEAWRSKLLAVLQVEEQNCQSYDTDKEITQFSEALDRYFGKPYGDEAKGRSRITTREIQETMSWLVPDLLDIFASGGRIADLEAEAPEAEQGLDQRADYLSYVFFKDNAGVLLLYDFIFDSLLHPRAYADVEWDARPCYDGWQQYRGLTQMQMQALLDAPDTDVDPDSLEIEEVPPDEAYPDGQAYGVRARRMLYEGKCQIEVCPPEDMFVASRSVDVSKARYKGRKLRWRRAEWRAKWPDLAEEINALPPNADGESVTDERREARFDDGETDEQQAAAADAEELVGRKEYVWWTFTDDNGEPKGGEVLLRVYRIGNVILEAEEVDDDPFASATAHRIPHRLQGVSMAELLGDLQKLKTVLTRALVDATMQANTPRMAADKNKVNLNDLLNLDVGAIIRTEGAPGDAVMPVAMPDLTPSTLKALEWTNQIIEQRTGVSRHAQGLDPDSLNHTAKGIQLLQNAANGVKRMIARLIAVGVEEMLTKVDRVIMRNQRQPRQVKIGKSWVKVDPRSWSEAMKVTVSVGLGTGSKEAQLGFLQMIQGDQVAWVANYGMQTPVVTPQHLYHTITEKLRIMGYQRPDGFFGDPVNPDGTPFVPQAPPSPDQQKIQAQVQEGQARLQLDQQKAQAQVQLDAQKAQAEAQLRELEAKDKSDSDARKAELDAEIARMRAKGELALMQQKGALEADIRQRQLEFEMQMGRAKFEFEKWVMKEKLDIQREAARAKADAASDADAGSMSATRMGGSAAV